MSDRREGRSSFDVLTRKKKDTEKEKVREKGAFDGRALVSSNPPAEAEDVLKPTYPSDDAVPFTRCDVTTATPPSPGFAKPKLKSTWDAWISSTSSTLLLLGALGFYCVVISISAASTKVVDEWGHALRVNVITNSVPLHHSSSDLGRNLLPHIDAPWLPDFLILALLFIGALAFVWPNPLNRHHVGDRRKRLALLLIAHGAILIMRTSTTVATVHPVSSPFCTYAVAAQLQRTPPPEDSNTMEGLHSQLHEQQRLQQEEEVGFLLNTGCYDMMFSGHVSFSLLLTLFTLQAPNLPNTLKVLSVLFTLGSVVGNIAVGDHYSSDVLVGSYISILVFLVFRKPLLKTYIHHYPPERSSSEDLNLRLRREFVDTKG